MNKVCLQAFGWSFWGRRNQRLKRRKVPNEESPLTTEICLRWLEKNIYIPFLVIQSDLFGMGLSDLQLADEKGTLNHLVNGGFMVIYHGKNQPFLDKKHRQIGGVVVEVISGEAFHAYM